MEIGQCERVTRPGLIVVSGLPGTGKSSLAGSLACEFGATLLVKDVIEASLWRSGVGRAQRSFEVSHELVTSLADDALRRGHNAIIDSVATVEDVRRDWRERRSSSRWCLRRHRVRLQ